MRRLVRCLCLLFSFLFPVALYAGQIYGFIVKEDGTPLKGAEININCGGAPIRGTTAGDGTYRINVPQQGPCKLTLPSKEYGGASANVVSYSNPSQYNFQLVGNQLQRR
jgi:carboxypeptidase family protein